MTRRISEKQIEALTLRLGHELFDRMERGQPSIFQSQWWQELGLAQCMKNEWLKIQAFRFIDVLPTVGYEPREIARHMKEYFMPPRRAAGHTRSGPHAEPAAALAELDTAGSEQRLVRLAERVVDFSDLDGLRPRLLAWIAWRGALKMAGRFIAGTTVDEAQRAIRRLRDQGLAFTIDVLGEAALSRREAEAYHQIYLDLIRELPRHAARWPGVALIDEGDGVALPRVNVSVKLTSLHPGLDAIAPRRSKEYAKELLRPLLREAMAAGVHIHIDMEHHAIKDLTLDICRELFTEPEFRDYPHLGIVLQAYLKDAERDLENTIEWVRRRGTRVWVRLVKGAYWDSETVWAAQAGWPCPVWERKWQSDACYERMTRRLLQNWRYTPAAFASHNVRSLAHAMALRRLWEVPAYAFETQMLYGMGDPIKQAVVEMGERCRIYTPYGQLMPGMAYLIRRLLENTANEGFLRSATADTPREQLLENPEAVGARTPPFTPPIIIKYELEEPIMDPFENVPNTDFSREHARRDMQAGLAHARARMGAEIPLRIGDERVETGRWFESYNPSRPGEIVARVARAREPEIERAVAAAHDTLPAWRDTDPPQRANTLFRTAELLQQHRFELAGLLVYEAAKPWRYADAEVSCAIDFCNYYGKEMLRLANHPRRRDIPGETNEYVYRPRGVTAVITPWNLPLASAAGMTAAALVTGNTVVLKPSCATPATAARLVDLLMEAGVPAGAVNVLYGPGTEIGEALVCHAGVATVALAGSRAVGQRVYRLAAEHPAHPPTLKHVVAHLGGNNAMIIDSDADLDEAIKAVKESAFGYAGQRCSAARRCVVLDAIHDRFVDRLVEAARGVSVGPADDAATFVGPLIDTGVAGTLREVVDEARRVARCVLEVDTSAVAEENDGAAFVGPLIFTDVPPDARLAREEVFGPVVAVQHARDFDHAIELFNGTDFALAGGVFSRSPAHIDQARHQCECGNLYINRRITDARVDLQPFGGSRMSGTGHKAGGPDYLVQFCQPQTISENTLRRGFAPSEEVVETLG